MPMVQGLMRTALFAAALSGLTALSASAAPTDPAAPAPSDHLTRCFYMSDWQGWSAPSDDVLYLRVRNREVYRVDLSGGSSLLQWPDMHLVTQVHGTDSVCYPIDLDLAISDGHGMYEKLMPKAISKLTDEQIAAIPKKYRP